MKLKVSKRSGPSPLERGWGEVKLSRKGFQHFSRTTGIINIFFKLSLRHG